MKYSHLVRVLFVFSLIVANSRTRAYASETNEATQTRRDEGALNLLQSTIRALSPGDGASISDYRLDGVAALWDGRDIRGTFSQVGVGAADRKTVITANGDEIFSLLVRNDAGMLHLGPSVVSVFLIQ
jgi:hypothetical protein